MARWRSDEEERRWRDSCSLVLRWVGGAPDFGWSHDEVWYLVHTVKIAVEVVREGGEEAESGVARELLGFLWRHLGAHHALLSHFTPDRHRVVVLSDVIADVKLIAVALGLDVAPHRICGAYEKTRRAACKSGSGLVLVLA